MGWNPVEEISKPFKKVGKATNNFGLGYIDDALNKASGGTILDGTSKVGEKVAKSREKQVKKDAAQGSETLEKVKQAMDSAASLEGKELFDPLQFKSILNPKMNTELTKLLEVFELRRQSIANRRAQPGISQTRLG